LKGKVVLLLGEFDEAIEAYNQILEHKPGDKEATDKLSKAREAADYYKAGMETKDGKECVIQLGKALQEAKESISIRLQRVKCALKAKLFPVVQMEIKYVHNLFLYINQILGMCTPKIEATWRLLSCTQNICIILVLLTRQKTC
jgi:tetratricopeptide (TPR) repeat protein